MKERARQMLLKDALVFIKLKLKNLRPTSEILKKDFLSVVFGIMIQL